MSRYSFILYTLYFSRLIQKLQSKINYMEQIPLPSPVHYELILQLLERQTLTAVSSNPTLRNQVNQLIISLRKAVAQQKQLEEACQSSFMEVDHRWSLNHLKTEQVVTPD
jgi:hypothetical protein